MRLCRPGPAGTPEMEVPLPVRSSPWFLVKGRTLKCVEFLSFGLGRG